MKLSMTKIGGLTVAKMAGICVIDTVTKMGEAHGGKNRWNSLWQKLGELMLYTP